MKKSNRKSDSLPPPLLRRPAPAPYFHPLFLIFQISPLQWRISKFTPPPLKRKGWGRTMWKVKGTRTLLKLFWWPLQLWLNPLQATVPFLCSLKASKNQGLSQGNIGLKLVKVARDVTILITYFKNDFMRRSITRLEE